MGDRAMRSFGARILFLVGFYKYSAATRLSPGRCWNYSVRVGESARYPTVCERCIEALEEIEVSPQLS
jgi:hypothetical protein